jgi:hypothetical protein
MVFLFYYYKQFDFAWSFSEGLAPIGIGKGLKRGYIDKNGRMIIVPQFDAAGSFTEGLAMVNIDNKIAHIDKEGKFIWGPSD